MIRTVWYRRNVFKKEYDGFPQTLVYKLLLGAENALCILSTAVLRNLEFLGGIN